MSERELPMTQDRTQMGLFPEIQPYSNGFLKVDDIHELYWEQCGNPDGKPIVFLHGGPGAGAGEVHRRFFDPEHYRIIIFDQRGAGRSTPLGSLENNTTQHLIQDIETLRKHLKINKWHIFGGSWGATLALLYAINHPQNCSALILRGIFLCQQYEIDHFINGIQYHFPEAWEQFSSFYSAEEKDDLLNAYYNCLTGDDEERIMQVSIAWALYESACSLLNPNFETITTDEQKMKAKALAKLEAHFFLNEVISEEDSILNKIDSIRHIPAVIIHGRYDMICPLLSAHKLHQAWPEADYIIVPDAGHSALDPAMRSRLISATENFKTVP